MPRFFRFFVSEPLEEGKELWLQGERFHYISNVLRFKKGDELTIFNGKGGEFVSEIVEILKGKILVRLKCYLAKDVESPLKIHLGQIVSKKEHMDYTIQKATELGVITFTPLFGDRSEVKLSSDRLNTRLERWRKIIIHACEQSGRNYLMDLRTPMSFKEYVSVTFSTPLLFLEPKASNKISNLPGTRELSLVIGPEGGFSEQELIILNEYGALGVNLGPRILRTETAGLVGISILQSIWGDI